jgi:hypothetical protein
MRAQRTDFSHQTDASGFRSSRIERDSHPRNREAFPDIETTFFELVKMCMRHVDLIRHSVDSSRDERRKTESRML